jgi:L-fuconolactonase
MLTLHRELRMPPAPVRKIKGPMRIDAHQHFWRYRCEDYPWIGTGMDLLAQDRLPYQFQPLLDAQGLHASITVQARPGHDETAFLLEMARRDQRIAGIIGWEDIGSPMLAERMEHWGGSKLLGLRHPMQEDDDAELLLALPQFNQGVRWLQERDYVLDLLAHERHLPQLRQLCAHHDQHWIVLNHLGKPALKEFRKAAPPERWRQGCATGRHAHVARKISGLLTEADWLRGLCTRDFDTSCNAWIRRWTCSVRSGSCSAPTGRYACSPPPMQGWWPVREWAAHRLSPLTRTPCGVNPRPGFMA